MKESPYNSVADNIKRIRNDILEAASSAGRDPEEIVLMAVTKTVPADIVNIAVENGVTLLGENRAQELSAKYGDYKKDGVSIHFIGRLQTNKVKQITGMVDMIHSVDSLRLAAEIDRHAKAAGKVMDALIEVNAAGEASKAGVTPGAALSLAGEMEAFANIRLRGLMTIPPLTESQRGIEECFEGVYKVFIDIKAKNRDNSNVNILSMGMSLDYKAAIRHGSNIVRLGTAIFGSRA